MRERNKDAVEGCASEIERERERERVGERGFNDLKLF